MQEENPIRYGYPNRNSRCIWAIMPGKTNQVPALDTMEVSECCQIVMDSMLNCSVCGTFSGSELVQEVALKQKLGFDGAA